jgi:hypothetical protein
MKSIPKGVWIAGAAVLAVVFMSKVFRIVLGMDRPEAMVLAIFFVFAAVVVASWWLFINFPPTCENRVCRPRDYSVVGVAMDLGIPGYEPVLQCRCGHRYLRRGSRFFAINRRNYLEKYMIKVNWYARWSPDDS